MKYIFLFSLFLIASESGYSSSREALQNANRAVESTVKILLEQPDSIEIWNNDRVYIAPARITVLREGVFVCTKHSQIEIPAFAIDDHGIFILCSKEEAKDHYDRAMEALRDAVGHSIGAGAAFAVEQPVIGVYEGYRAVEKYKEFGREYSRGIEAENRGTKGDPSDSKD